MNFEILDNTIIISYSNSNYDFNKLITYVNNNVFFEKLQKYNTDIISKIYHKDNIIVFFYNTMFDEYQEEYSLFNYEISSSEKRVKIKSNFISPTDTNLIFLKKENITLDPELNNKMLYNIKIYPSENRIKIKVLFDEKKPSTIMKMIANMTIKIFTNLISREI